MSFMRTSARRAATFDGLMADLETAIRTGCRMAARNVGHRGATGLRDHLLGRLTAV